MANEPIEFMKYDKISDDVYLLGNNVILKFNVSLSKISQDNKRFHFYKEFEYGSRAIGYPKLLTIKRSFDYYLSIENIQKNKVTDEKAFIRIGPYDYFKLMSQLDQVYAWFTDKKYKNLFASNRGKLILTNPVPESALRGYPQNKFLRFVPTIIDKTEGDTSMERGVELDLSDYNNYVVMSLDRFMGFYYTISRFNMYEAAQNLVGYLGFPGGTNRINMGNNNSTKIQYVDELHDSGMVEGVNDRVIDKNKNISSLE